MEGDDGPRTIEEEEIERKAVERRARRARREVASATLRFDATQAEPNFAAHFLAGGGVLGSAAGAGQTDFSLTGSTEAVNVQLEGTTITEVAIEVPEHILGKLDYAASDGTLYIDARAKLNACCSREGAGVNGTYVTTHVGAGALYLRDVLDTGGHPHLQFPIVYGTLGAFSAVIGISNVRFELRDAAGAPITGLRSILLEDTLEVDGLSALAETEVDSYARRGWTRRYEHVKYIHAPTLTKTVARVPVGVNDSGYNLVPFVVDQDFPYGTRVLDGLLERAIAIDGSPAGKCHALDGDDPDDYRLRALKRPTPGEFLEATRVPGLRAAAQAPIVATALSDIANFLMPYRADGRTVLQTAGSGFTAVESWLRTTQRRWDEANDCDGSALLIVSMLQLAKKEGARIAALPPERGAERDAWIAAHPYVWALRNTVHPHYTYGVAVVGAAAAEASDLPKKQCGDGGSCADATPLAGHAIALMVPTVQLLHALHDGSQQTIGGAPVTDDVRTTHGKRFEAVYSTSVRAELADPAEAEWLQTSPVDFGVRPGEATDAYAAQRAAMAQLEPQAMEGTTPAASGLVAGAGMYDAVAAGVQLDNCAFAAAAPNIGRSRKILFVGGAGESHRFYHDLVEFDLPGDHPWFRSPELREQCEACGQIVFAPEPTVEFGDENEAAPMDRAGVSPADLVRRTYVAAPLATVNVAQSEALDHAAARAVFDVMPPRPASGRALSAPEAKRLRQSIAHLHDLNASFAGTGGEGHPVAYILSYATIVHNPTATKHFCRQIAAAATTAHADILTIEGLATYPDGAEAGHFAVVHAMVKV